MRLPLTPQLSTKDGAANKNARLTNMLREKDKAVVRPGLSLVLDYAGVGNGLVPFNDHLIGLFDDTVYDLDAMGTASPGVSDGVLDLTTVNATPVALAYVAWDAGWTYPLGWTVTYSGTDYTSTVSGNVGITPGTSASWSPFSAGTVFALTAGDIDESGTQFGFDLDLSTGSINPSVYLTVPIKVCHCDTETQFFQFGVHGGIGLEQSVFTSISIGAHTFLSTEAVYFSIGDAPDIVTAWLWSGAEAAAAIPSVGEYTVTIT